MNKRRRVSGKEFCASIDAIAEQHFGRPAVSSSDNTYATIEKRKKPTPPPPQDKKGEILIEVQSNYLPPETFVSKRHDRLKVLNTILKSSNKKRGNNFIGFQIEIMSIVEDYEMQKVTRMVLRRSHKLNSAQYYVTIVKKALDLCTEIDNRLQCHSPEKIWDVKIDALYIYRHIILSSGAALRRVRTPANQLHMCHRVASLVNGHNTGAYDAGELCTTSLIQFVSGLPPYYSKIVPTIGDMQLCINSLVRQHGLSDEMRAEISLIIEMVSVLSKTFCDKKPMNIVQGVCLFLNPTLLSSSTVVPPNSAHQIADFVRAVISQHQITDCDLKELVSLMLRQPLHTNFRNTRQCTLAFLMMKRVEKSFLALREE